MADMHFQELNLMQMLDVVRDGGIARMALAQAGRPYVVPMAFQLEMRGLQPILHLASPLRGRKMDILRENDRVCLEVERPACAWTDVVLVEGRAVLTPCQGGACLQVPADSITGRRCFLRA